MTEHHRREGSWKSSGRRSAPRNVLTDPEKLADYGHDEFSLRDIARIPEAVVLPATTDEVAAVLRLADARRIPVTPRGGATGLCGGCVPAPGGIVLSLERMNRVVSRRGEPDGRRRGGRDARGISWPRPRRPGSTFRPTPGTKAP